MLTEQTNCVIAATGSTMHGPWVVAEYNVLHPSGAYPPQCIMVLACTWPDALTMRVAMANSELRRMVTSETMLTMVIRATGDKGDCMAYASRIIANMPARPYCNEHGHNVLALGRRIGCSNGETYANQSAAARALGIAQSSISQCLAGKARTVGGWEFWYVTAGGERAS